MLFLKNYTCVNFRSTVPQLHWWWFFLMMVMRTNRVTHPFIQTDTYPRLLTVNIARQINGANKWCKFIIKVEEGNSNYITINIVLVIIIIITEAENGSNIIIQRYHQSQLHPHPVAISDPVTREEEDGHTVDTVNDGSQPVQLQKKPFMVSKSKLRRVKFCAGYGQMGELETLYGSSYVLATVWCKFCNKIPLREKIDQNELKEEFYYLFKADILTYI